MWTGRSEMWLQGKWIHFNAKHVQHVYKYLTHSVLVTLFSLGFCFLSISASPSRHKNVSDKLHSKSVGVKCLYVISHWFQDMVNIYGSTSSLACEHTDDSPVTCMFMRLQTCFTLVSYINTKIGNPVSAWCILNETKKSESLSFQLCWMSHIWQQRQKSV